MIRPYTVAPLTVFALLVFVLGLYLWQVGSGKKYISQLPSTMIDKPVPEFVLPPIALTDINTLGLKTSDLLGKVSLVNIWASWCLPCRIEHPVLMALAKEGVTIYGINYRDKPYDALNFLKTLGNPYKRIGADSNGRVAIEWGVYGYPETFVVDATGQIRYRHVGPINSGQLDAVIRPLLNGMSK